MVIDVCPIVFDDYRRMISMYKTREVEMQSSNPEQEKLLQKYNILFEQVQQAPNSPQLLVRLGDACMELGRRDEALFYYKKAIKLDPGLDDVIKKMKENYGEEELESVEIAEKALPFWQNIGAVARYPFTKQGSIVMLAGAVLFAFINIIPLVGPLICLFFVYPYVIAYMLRIIRTTANGHKGLPDWPEFSDWWESIVRPCLQVIVVTAISFAPAIIAFIIALLSSAHLASSLLFFILIFAGTLYYPMALIAVAVYDNAFVAFNFPQLLASIWKIKKSYFLSLITLWLFAFIGIVVSTFLAPISIPIIGPFISWVVTLYFAIVQMVIIGNVYYINKTILRWF